ncbi:autotransporter-associated beta strand repeat-containing protein [Gemmata sp. JC673]|uniref:Autotransporter-associated beta strand repeat-containing protein n=1 Tax=Gemmata algarum TaxID=2975278 RepID=A0ABU5EQZ3_9BACT|nr:autotransporter-associated beta strand repeat-containing protein [Gemmata algarum]MDY3557767.1 autotransporter-associated beta strand repeat-containing protein [Gemmata algarum]
MLFSTLSRRFRDTFTPRTRIGARPWLQLTALEDRSVPATLTWTGTGGNLLWSNSGNWSGNVAPVTGDTLIFPTGVTGLTNNNYQAGTLSLNDIQIQGDGYTLIGNDVTLDAALTDSAASGSTTISLNINGAGSISKTGAGDFILNASSTLTGAVTISAGTFTIVSPESLADTAAVTVASGANFVLDGADETIGSLTGGGTISLGTSTLTTGGNNGSTTFSGTITGSGNLVKTGTGTFTLSGTNSGYTGGTTVTAGALVVANDSALGSGALTLGGGTLSFDADRTVANAITLNAALSTIVVPPATAVTLSGVISQTGGARGINKFDGGTLTLSGANTFTGPVALNGGTLTLAGGAALNDAVAVTVAGGATLALSADETIGSLAGSGAVSLGAFNLTTGGNNGSTTLSGAVSGTGTVFKNGTGTFTLSGTNTYGNTTVLGGTLSVATDANLGTGPIVLSPGSTFQITGTTNINNPIAIGGGTATIDNALAVELSGVISAPGGLTKTGAGTLTLSTSSSYTGATTVAAGTLLIDGNFSSSSGFQVASGAVLGGTGDLPAVSVASGGTLAPGGTPGLLATGNLNLALGSTLGVELVENAPATPVDPNDRVDVTGTVTLTAATLAVTLGFIPAASTSYTLISNDGSDPVVGTFLGLAEGATFFSNGVGFTITYAGGDGNDVVITTLPSVASISGATTVEGNEGTRAVTFTVTLEKPSAQTVTINYATVDETAVAGSDYVAASGTLTFAPGETSKTITVLVNGDTLAEANETFAVVLSNPVNATLFGLRGIGTIINDDTATSTVVSVSSGGGTAGTVRLVDPVTGAPGQEVVAFAGFGGEIRVASGDVNGDGRSDTVTGAGAGAPGGHVKVFSPDGTLIRSFLAFDGFTGGVFVATGDVNGDGFDDIVVSADAGAAPHVKVFSGKDGSLLRSFLAYDAGFRGGVRVSVADVDGDGFDDIVTGNGAGAVGHVKVFSGKDGSVLRSFFAYDAFTGGVYVAAGDLDGDGRADIVTGAGAGAAPHVKVFSGRTGAQQQSFFAYDSGFTGGVRVGVGVIGNKTYVLTGAGPGAGPHVKGFVNGVQELSLLAGAPSLTGGVYVG